MKFDLNYFLDTMPKIVDNYVFERKIGSGQYGDVFKGYNKNSGNDIAIKAIKRETIKGKFMQLLQNEIKVLKTCDNRNIIKLYDIKKTANNFYLIIEYCNEGDLMTLLKKKKTLSEEEAIRYFVQILNAFKTLVKNKIMHRDCKLANILMHDGEIKIADFGFSKLLGSNEEFTETMLGSPLNMAPEVLGGRKYGTKADIWSLGTCFYELLFGTPPYKAGNMVDLINNIKNKAIAFPKQVNSISPITEDVIKRMLIIDPVKRIEWEEVFKHPITTYLEEKVKADMQNTMKSSEDAELSMSKFYLKNNMVVEHPKQIENKENINSFAYGAVKKGNDGRFGGKITKRINQQKREGGSEKSLTSTTQTIDTQKGSQKEIICTQETLRQKQIKAFKRNGNRLLHYRNIYVFLASVSEETMSRNIRFCDIAGYLLIRKLLTRLQWLKEKIENKKYFAQMEFWDLFVHEKDYQDIRSYVDKEYDVFNVFYTNIHNKIKDRVKEFDEQAQAVIKDPKSSITEKVYQKIIRQYINCLNLEIQEKKMTTEAEEKKLYIHLGRIIDCLSIDKVFKYEQNGEYFNFREYYSKPQRLPLQELYKQISHKLHNI